jgi:hypothetical protein
VRSRERVNVYNALYCVLQGPGVSPPRLLTLWVLENNQVLLRTSASDHIPIVILLSSWCLKKGGESKKKRKEERERELWVELP